MPERSDRTPSSQSTPTRSFGLRSLAALPFGFLLFGLWLVLSPKRDLFHLGLGALTACAIALLSGRLVGQSPPIAEPNGRSLLRMPWHRFVGYLPWLAWQVMIASVQVAYVVLHPRLPVDPRLLRVRVRYPHTLARLTLANSITLTPGTVTLDVDGDEYLVHSLTEASGKALEQGTMPDRVSTLFGVKAEGIGS
ncbi:MAG: Na+/H+ antiporter subunit E [Vicinamibacterales bacterium]|jgi:multicomponent Na+:H+ antiporter subunit E|nr:Na+/H+ antiporter subunit E [Vicinamibacterales bacterium]